MITEIALSFFLFFFLFISYEIRSKNDAEKKKNNKINTRAQLVLKYDELIELKM